MLVLAHSCPGDFCQLALFILYFIDNVQTKKSQKVVQITKTV